MERCAMRGSMIYSEDAGHCGYFDLTLNTSACREHRMSSYCDGVLDELSFELWFGFLSVVLLYVDALDSCFCLLPFIKLTLHAEEIGETQLMQNLCCCL